MTEYAGSVIAELPEFELTGEVPDPGDSSTLLDRRLAVEAERRGLTVDACRDVAIAAGLDAFRREREVEQMARERDANREALEADVLLVTATRTEREELLREIDARDPESRNVQGRLSKYRRATIGDWRVACLHVEMGLFHPRGAVASCAVAREETVHARILIGTLLSGGAIVQSASYRDRLVRWHGSQAPSDIVGGEMEAAGLVAAADDQDWLLVKGVCDMGDGESRSNQELLRQWQQDASRNAAITILETLAATKKEESE